MANTYVAISSQVLASTAASVTFSSIPSTYTDLIIKISAKNSDAGSGTDWITYTVNGDTGTNYSGTRLYLSGSTITNNRYSTNNQFIDTRITSAGETLTSSFGQTEIYIPNYTSTSSRQLITFGVAESGDTFANINSTASLYRGVSSISSITFAVSGSYNFIAGSRFDLYGITHL